MSRLSKKTFYVLLGLFCAIVISVVSLGISAVSKANAKDGWSEISVEAEYDYKTNFTVPERTFTENGNEYVASHLVVLPNGTVTDKDDIYLNIAGEYVIKYSVDTGSNVYADSRMFLVNYPSYDISSGKSSLTYGTPDRATNSGVMVRLTQGDALTFTQYIDFTKITSEDKLVEGFVTPDIVGIMDFSELILTFADSVDPSIYMQVHYYSYAWGYYTYAAVNGNNQVPVGVHQSQGLHENDGFGLWSYVTFVSVGRDGVVAPDETQFFISMDYGNKKLYTWGFPTVVSMIADLDDTSIVKNVWAGFPSGKARLSISAEGYSGATANFCITSVYGIENLEENVYLDNVAPIITVEDEYNGEMPKGLLGYEYLIPTATAYDEYAGYCDVEVSVIFNYGTDNVISVPVNDGKFVTDKVGIYGILYTAKDKVGNTSYDVRWVFAFEETENADFEIPADKKTEAFAGEWIAVPEIPESTITGGSGKKTLSTFIEYDGNREEIFGGFRVLSAGEYKVVYVCSDYVGKKTEKYYEVTVTYSDTPILEKDFDVYPAYISGMTYELPTYSAYVYENGRLNEKLCEVVISDAQGTTTYMAGDKAKIQTANNGDKVSFDVKCNGITLAYHESAGILAWVQEEVGLRFHIENYFYGEGFSKEKTNDGVIFSAENEDEFSFVYANVQPYRYLRLKLADIKGANKNSRIEIVFTDVLDNTLSCSAVLGSTGTDAYFELGGNKTVLSGTAISGNSFEIIYFDGVYSVNGKEIGSLSIPFESDNVFIKIRYSGYTEEAGFAVSELGNAIISTAQTDRIKPVIVATHEIGGTWKTDTVYTLYMPIAYDVYSPNIVYTLNVTDPEGNYVTSLDGVKLENADPNFDYEILLDRIGQYLVTYTVYEDSEFIKRGNEARHGYALTVSDDEKPEITWKGKFVEEAKVGDIIVVPDYTVSDNHSSAENIVVKLFVETPAHQLYMLPGNSILVNHEGIYQFSVMVIDEAGNITCETYLINVTKELK